MFLSNRKFFDVNVPEQPSTTSAPINIAELMAKQGTKTDSNSPALEPIIITEKKEEPAAQATQPLNVAPTSEATNAETPVNQETPPPVVEQPIVDTPPIVETPVITQTWQEVLKQQQPEEVYKELGLNDSIVSLSTEFQEGLPEEMVNFLKHWKNNGNVNEYLKALNTDYSNMPAEDVMRHQLQADYPEADARTLDILYKKKVIEAYNLNSDDEELKEEGQLLMQAEASRYRKTMAANQKNFLLPKPPEAKANPVDDIIKQQEAQAKQNLEAYQTQINGSPLTKAIATNKFLTVGEGEDSFKLPIQNVNELTDLLFDSKKWALSLYKNEGGKQVPDVEKQLVLSAIAKNYKGFFSEYAKHLKAIGAQAAIKPIENAKPPDGTTPAQTEAEITDPAAAMAKYGKVVSR